MGCRRYCSPFQNGCRKYVGITPLIVEPGIKTGMPILHENPSEVGADRIVNAVAGYDKYKKSLIIIDFGTATTFDYVTQKGEYVGGCIAPGMMISLKHSLRERQNSLVLSWPSRKTSLEKTRSMPCRRVFPTDM